MKQVTLNDWLTKKVRGDIHPNGPEPYIRTRSGQWRPITKDLAEEVRRRRRAFNQSTRHLSIT